MACHVRGGVRTKTVIAKNLHRSFFKSSQPSLGKQFRYFHQYFSILVFGIIENVLKVDPTEKVAPLSISFFFSVSDEYRVELRLKTTYIKAIPKGPWSMIILNSIFFEGNIYIDFPTKTIHEVTSCINIIPAKCLEIQKNQRGSNYKLLPPAPQPDLLLWLDK